MSLDERVSDLIKRIYCAGQDAGAWDQVSREVVDLTGGHAAFTSVVDLSQGVYCSTKFYGPEETTFDRGFEEYGELYRYDPSLIWAAHNPTARFCDSRQTLPRDNYLDHPYLRWQRDRLRTVHWFVGYTPPERDRSFSFSLLFPDGQDAGDATSIRLFQMLFEHMDAAVQLRGKRFDDQADAAFISLDSKGNVFRLSQGASNIVSETDGLDIHANRLRTLRLVDQAALDDAVGRTANVLVTGGSQCVVSIARPSGKRPWIAIIRPDFRDFPGFGNISCGTLVELRDSSPPFVSAHLLQSFFAITEREAELLQMLIGGHSIESLAHKMGISPNTARVHLHSIFLKTSTTRQSELLQLCGRLQM